MAWSDRSRSRRAGFPAQVAPVLANRHRQQQRSPEETDAPVSRSTTRTFIGRSSASVIVPLHSRVSR
jgi:hypothetical protein